MRRFVPSLCASVFGLLVLGSGCEGRHTASPTERLWVSGIPKNTKATLTAFITARTTGDKYIGAFFSGSVFRGGHNVFEWKNEGEDGAALRFLQDDVTKSVRFETCEPSTGFDYCLLMHGDPTGTMRYQSRKRWTVKRPGKRHSSSISVTDVLFELAEDEPDLRAAFSDLESMP
jgi:hypothetical protein